MTDWIKAEASRLRRTVVHSWHGWRAAWASEKTLRQWTLANILSAVLAFWLDLTGLERAVLLINTAVETTVDRIGPNLHPLSKKAKDVGSACVAVAALTALIVWLAVLFG